MEKKKSLSMIIMCLAVICAAIIAFVAGRRYGGAASDSGRGTIIVLTENQTILDDSGNANGLLPKGMKLYVVSDPYANELSLFRAYFQANDANKGVAPAESSKNDKELKTNFIRGESELQK